MEHFLSLKNKMQEIDILELEKKFQSTWDTASVDELYEMHDQYRTYLESQLEKDPKNVHALTHLGTLCWEPFHEDEKAIEYLERAISYDPQNIEARFWLARCYYFDYCAYEKARQLLLEALAIDPTRAECLTFLASIIMETTEKIDEAINYREKAIQYAPDWPMLRLCTVELYIKKKDFKAAKFHIEKALKCRPFFIPPKNYIECYYEKIITGRSWKNIEEEFVSYIEIIPKTKLE